MKKIAVVCFLWSNPTFRAQYSQRNVEILHSMVRRHLTIPFNFYCMTDKPENLNLGKSVKVISLQGQPAFNLPVIGTWPALSIFNQRLYSQIKEDVILKLDLDCVIVRSLDPIIKGCKIDDRLAGWLDVTHKILNPSFALFKKGNFDWVYEKFLDEPQLVEQLVTSGVADKFGWDQAFMAKVIPEDSKFYLTAESGIFHRREIQVPASLPQKARIVYFNSTHKPWHDKMKLYYPWIKQHYL